MLAWRGDVAEGFALLDKHGYTAAELMVRDVSLLNAKDILRQAGNENIAIPAVSTGQLRKEDGLSLCAPDREARQIAIDRTKAVIDFAAHFGAVINIGTLRGQLPTGTEREAAVLAAQQSIAEILEYAARVQVTVNIEPQCRYVINWLNTVDSVLAFANSFGTLRPYVLFDLYHAMLEEESVYAALIRARDQIRWLQIADTNRRAPGQGHWNFAEWFRILRALKYEGYVSVECMQGESSERTLAGASRFLHDCIRQDLF